MLPLKGSEKGNANRKIKSAHAQQSNRGEIIRFSKGVAANSKVASKANRIVASQYAQNRSAILLAPIVKQALELVYFLSRQFFILNEMKHHRSHFSPKNFGKELAAFKTAALALAQ